MHWTESQKKSGPENRAFMGNKTKEVDNDIDLHTSGPDYIMGLIMKRLHYFLILFLTGILFFTSTEIIKGEKNNLSIKGGFSERTS